MSLLTMLDRLFNRKPKEQKHVAVVGNSTRGKTSLLAAMAAMVAVLESKSFFKQRVIKRKHVKVVLTSNIPVRFCSGLRHAWFNSNVGLIRKPLSYVNS